MRNYVKNIKNEFHGYNSKKLTQDFIAGITVAAVALPLSLAFAVSCGASAASGIISSIISGFVIGGLAGASFQISGPTGAMTTVLFGMAAQFGVQGIFITGLLAGIILLICAVLKVGRLISFIPPPVTTGFTSGVAVIIALGQVNNFFGVHSEG
ncbi:MAG: SulP family inorganic anion transporter, partial [Oscillospiraceae bacterium]